jgi:hypothetical protein
MPHLFMCQHRATTTAATGTVDVAMVMVMVTDAIATDTELCDSSHAKSGHPAAFCISIPPLIQTLEFSLGYTH